jgi:haloalkane dehalogenase
VDETPCRPEPRSTRARWVVLAAAALVTAAVATSCRDGDQDARRRSVASDQGEDHWVPRGEHRIHAREHPGAEPALVLMHGFPDNSHLYDRLVPELSGRRVITFDFLGWGRSDKPQDHDYTFENQQADLDAVIDHFDLDQVSLVGHDAAGPAAVNWALDHPDRTASLTLMNAFYSPTPAIHPPALISFLMLGSPDQPVAQDPLTENVVPLVEEVMSQPEAFRRIFEWQERQFFARPTDADHFTPLFYEQFEGDGSSRGPLVSLARDAVAAVGANAARLDELASFPRPIQLIWGDQDPDLSSGIARDLHAVAPDSELFILPEAHHNLQIDEPERVAEILLAIPQPG